MKKLSMRKLSLLGLVLLAASAVTAAVIPKDSLNKKTAGVVNSLSDSTNVNPGCQQLTCSTTVAVDPGKGCEFTGDSCSTITGRTSFTCVYQISKTETDSNPTSTDLLGIGTSGSPC